ncbi:alanyl-tRNA editing protein AlaX-L (plasmid) [Peptoclostridium acidaminophilum DSM 3953]|uniref:Alanyl-tRNA editing protein AlaX-L n=1 Tax=Peptoclostridium acidaminophilum DSM 3953 TaxID=1286171 RepID=W8UAF3_PEPAC|nr:DHHA1 domain-containing protein [Peptoclostridium acidaminophilum]AHM57776.1 alanyl-tRNA editing protein AlaX-L [Peptoclostridium acidaminophilum DSM 3953]
MTSEKIFMDDSYITELEAEVASCVQKDEYYEVILDKTIFYPHMSGGQPKDEGTISGIKVINVLERGDEIVHLLKEPVEGTVKLSVDFGTRFDYMQQHTGQHILSYALAKLFGGNTVGFHLSESYTTIDLDILLTDEMVVAAEQLSNRIIYENKKVTAREYAYEDALKLNLSKMPVELDHLRIISIENYDDNACGGTHVNYTGEIGIIKVTKKEKYKSGTRVEFLCGRRALDDYIVKNKSLLDLSALLTCRADMLQENIEKILNENKKLTKDISTLGSELNEYKARELTSNAVVKDGVSFVFNKSDNDVKDLRSICSKLIETDNYAAVLVSESDNTCNLVMGQSKNLSLDMKNIFEQCKAVINGKGGGNNYLLQCTGDLLRADECLELARNTLL